MKRKAKNGNYGEQVNARMPDGLKQRIKVCAALDGVSIQQWIADAIADKVTKRLEKFGPFDRAQLVGMA